MNQSDFSYCVVIRTLGLAGEPFQQELNSLLEQTIKPKKIIIYLAEGYEIPKETIGIEQYVYVKKGMVAQRALPYTEVDTELMLMLDDDVYLPPDGVEKLYRGLIEHKGDCISPDVFKTHQLSVTSKLLALMTNFVLPRSDDQWAFKINKTSSFSYNNRPKNDVYLSQSAAGPASLWRTESFRNIHFKDELWLDQLGFAYGEDLLCYHKLYKNGGLLLVHYTTAIKHLDAGTSRKDYMSDPNRLVMRSMIHFIIWWRTCYQLDTNRIGDKTLAALAYSFKFLLGVITHIAYSLAKFSMKPILAYLKGHIKGWTYVHSSEYKKIPNFILPRKLR